MAVSVTGKVLLDTNVFIDYLRDFKGSESVFAYSLPGHLATHCKGAVHRL
jgi:hypothetical protein